MGMGACVVQSPKFVPKQAETKNSPKATSDAKKPEANKSSKDSDIAQALSVELADLGIKVQSDEQDGASSAPYHALRQ